ncbi:SUN domain-containing protein 1 isoform X2 [Ictalurus furcatus]|uniref:SUN domain-containing protein 1 isoform X2 n=1 Tax=Ictalurus furcatus TaxID=66913 RepID=UPI002350E2D5|nr:SUN domain-containing protein 1 isoform X2 [Ictalurus furcatus]
MVYSKVHTHTTAQQHDADNTGYTYSLSSSYSSSALEYEREHKLAPVFESPRMSRRSLRLHTNSTHYGDDSLLDSSVNRGASYSTESRVHRESKTVKSRRSRRSVSGSSTLLQTPVKGQSLALQAHNSSMHSCAASDASLLSSLLDESSIQERTLVDSFWGLDKDGDLKDRTVHADHSFSLNNSGTHVAQTQTSTIHNSYFCNNCVASRSDRRDALQAYTSSKACSSSSCSYSSAALHSTAVDGAASAASASFSSPHTTVYSRERSRRHRAGVLGVVSEAFLHYSRRVCASVVCVFSILVQSVLKTGQLGKVQLCSLTDRCVRVCKRAGAALTRPAQFIGLGKTSSGRVNGGHASYCGTMNVNETVTQKDPHTLNGPLCDDCKEKQTSRTIAVSTSSSGAPWLVEALWVLVTFTGSSVLKVGQDVVSAAWFITRKILSVLYLAAVSPGSAASGAFQWLGTAWYQLVMLMSLFNVFFLTRILPILQKLFLVVLPFVLTLAVLWYWGLFSFSTIWPVANVTRDSAVNKAVDVQPEITLSHPTIEVQPEITLSDPTSEVRPDLAVSDTTSRELPVVSEADSERLSRIEQSLEMLWEKVTTSGGKQDERHAEVLGLCSSLKEELRTNTDKETMDQWVGKLLEQRISLLREEIAEKETEHSQQHPEEFEAGYHTQESRLAKIEALLQDLAQRTEELQTRPEAETPSIVSGEMDSASHLTLLAQVRKLEEALSDIRADLQGVTGCTGRCGQLDSLHDTISAQVKEELRVLLYGSEQKDMKLPGSLVQWLSTQFVSNSDLLASLGALEKSILGNLSLQLEEMQQKPSEEMITQSVLQATELSGLSEEAVQLIVQNALKRYSEDRIGLVDYALESGGGSILSTRCSETYETKTALMSLFGFPLWYFSQSPRAVIQPDVHPGNCWAFKGSTGYLVIRLCVKIVPTAFSLEHIPKALSPTGNISSAPRNFSVYGLEDEQQEEGQLLGQYVYQEDGDALQTYPVTENNTEAFQIIELRVLSNWGHPEYTCLYRFRVHGEPVQQ